MALNEGRSPGFLPFIVAVGGGEKFRKRGTRMWRKKGSLSICENLLISRRKGRKRKKERGIKKEEEFSWQHETALLSSFYKSRSDCFAPEGGASKAGGVSGPR